MVKFGIIGSRTKKTFITTIFRKNCRIEMLKRNVIVFTN